MYKNKQSGFSLVETLVAISLLLIVIAGQMSISNATKGSSYAREQTQAFFLAQEGVELVQNVRDKLFLEHLSDLLNGTNNTPEPWTNFVTSTISPIGDCFSASGCGLYFDNTNLLSGKINAVSCSTISNCLLRFSESASDRARYNHSATNPTSNPATVFTRRIFVTNSGDAVRVRAVVTWRTGSLIAGQEVSVDTYLYNTYNYD